MRRSKSWALSAVIYFLGSVGAGSACPGDCNVDGVVMVEEIVTVVNVLLERAPLEDCLSADYDLDDEVEIHEAVLAVRANLDDCPEPVCGNGILEVDEECEGSNDEMICYSNCRTCCTGGQCVVSKCCNGVQFDGFLPFDPNCRECGEVGEGCGESALLSFECCDNLSCWDLEMPDPRLISGTCCRPPGSECVDDNDCCGSNSFPWPSQPDLCVGGRCCVQTGSVCNDFAGARGPCCDPAAACWGRTALDGWATCCVPGPGGTCCIERGETCEAFGTNLGSCCVETDVCEGPGISGFASCCAPTGEPCDGPDDCCSGTCNPLTEGSGAVCG